MVTIVVHPAINYILHVNCTLTVSTTRISITVWSLASKVALLTLTDSRQPVHPRAPFPPTSSKFIGQNQLGI